MLVLAGLGLLGWYAWQTFGTTWVSHGRQEEVVEQLETEWGQGTAVAETDYGVAQAVIRIPRFGDDYVMPVLEGTSDEALAAGFGHLDGTAAAGQTGNYVVAAHRITHGEPLRDMPDLEPGDEVIVETQGERFTYRLTTGGDDLEVPFTASWVLDPLPVNPEAGGVQPDEPGALITLTTCAELFHTDERLVAFGVLVETAAITRLVE